MLTETIHAGAFIVSEAPGFRSREQVTIGLSQTLGAAQVSAEPRSPRASHPRPLPKRGIPVDLAPSPWTLPRPFSPARRTASTARSASSPAPTSARSRSSIRTASRSAGISWPARPSRTQIKFAIADGATDFVPGDAFSITVGVEAGDFEYAALDYAATDGLQNAAAIAIYPVTTDGSTKQKISIFRRSGEVRASDLTWPSGTAAQKAAAISQLEALAVILR
jgi:hypothetical protein